MVYAWNGFQLLCMNKQLLENVMRIVWDELMTNEETKGEYKGESEEESSVSNTNLPLNILKVI